MLRSALRTAEEQRRFDRALAAVDGQELASGRPVTIMQAEPTTWSETR